MLNLRYGTGVGKFILSGYPGWAGPILFPQRPIIRNGCVRNLRRPARQKYAIVETVATRQAFNFGLAKNEASNGKFCLFMLVKTSLVIKINVKCTAKSLFCSLHAAKFMQLMKVLHVIRYGRL